MKFKIAINVLTPEEARAGLTLDTDAGLRMVHEFVTRQRADLARADGQLRDATARVDMLAKDVPAGRATPADLDDALRAKQGAALTAPGFQARVTDAEAAVVQAKTQASARIIAEARRRGKALQDAADELTPVLLALSDAEAALDQVVLSLGDKHGIPPVTWPTCTEDQAHLGLVLNQPTKQ